VSFDVDIVPVVPQLNIVVLSTLLVLTNFLFAVNQHSPSVATDVSCNLQNVNTYVQVILPLFWTYFSDCDRVYCFEFMLSTMSLKFRLFSFLLRLPSFLSPKRLSGVWASLSQASAYKLVASTSIDTHKCFFINCIHVCDIWNMLRDTVGDVEASNVHMFKHLLGNVDFSKHCTF